MGIEFLDLLVPGATVQWDDTFPEPGPPALRSGTLHAVVWPLSVRESGRSPRVRIEVPDGPSRWAVVRPEQIVDVLPDRNDVDSVEAWLARGPLHNPFREAMLGLVRDALSSIQMSRKP